MLQMKVLLGRMAKKRFEYLFEASKNIDLSTVITTQIKRQEQPLMLISLEDRR